MTPLDAAKLISTEQEVASVWNPNTQEYHEYVITNIVHAPDTYSYGTIKDHGRSVAVYYSPFTYRWSR